MVQTNKEPWKLLHLLTTTCPMERSTAPMFFPLNHQRLKNNFRKKNMQLWFQKDKKPSVNKYDSAHPRHYIMLHTITNTPNFQHFQKKGSADQQCKPHRIVCILHLPIHSDRTTTTKMLSVIYVIHKPWYSLKRARTIAILQLAQQQPSLQHASCPCPPISVG